MVIFGVATGPEPVVDPAGPVVDPDPGAGSLPEPPQLAAQSAIVTVITTANSPFFKIFPPGIRRRSLETAATLRNLSRSHPREPGLPRAQQSSARDQQP
jgi:hypothetical protein